MCETQKIREAIRNITNRLVFGTLPPERRQSKRRRPASQQVAVYVSTLLNQASDGNSGQAADEPVLTVVLAGPAYSFAQTFLGMVQQLAI